MRPLFKLGTVGALIVLAGCATILGGGSSQNVTIQAAPPGATFTIKASSGIQMAAGTLPQTVRLPRKNEYEIDFTAPGYQPRSIALTRGTNGWVFGNLVVGWIVGFIVDFATGSAYKIEPALVSVTMDQKVAADGTRSTDAHVTLADAQGRTLRELVLPMEPVAAH